jgi:hypothetical protein
MKEFGPLELKFQTRVVPGKIYEVKLMNENVVQVWRADNGQEYFCHGLTFGGKEAPGGPVSLFGEHVPTILHGYYELVIPESNATEGDILVWRGISSSDIVHSAILTEPITAPGTDYLDYSSMLQTKNGIKPETKMSLETLIVTEYGESYNVYRRGVAINGRVSQ